MPAVVEEQVSRMNADEKLRLIAYIVKSMSADVERLKAPIVDALRVTRKKPCISDLIEYGRRFHPEYRFPEDVVLREGEEGYE